jgi:sarcosine oxidase/L-pipecolate oxidase
MITRYDGLFADADYRGAEEIFINPLSGWAEATPAVKNVMDAAIENGVKYVEGDVDTLVFDDKGNCTGMKLKEGQVLYAGQVILCTGAGTSKLLADSAPKRKDLQVEDRITAAAVVTGFLQLTHKQMRRFKNAPVFIHAVGDVLGIVT